MSKIVFFCIPAYGHVNPTLGVVRELVHRGNDVYYYSFSEFKAAIEDCGAHFVGCDHFDLGLDESPETGERIAKDILFSTEVIVRATLAMDDRLTADMQQLKPDVIVGDSVAYWGRLIAMKLDIPFVSSTTTFAFNSKSSSIMTTSFAEMIKMIINLPKTKKILAPLREKGYPADNILNIVQNDNKTNTIVYTSREFQPCAESFSDKYSFVGPSLRQAKEEIEATPEKLVYISMGTVNNRYSGFYSDCINAFNGSELRVIMSVGGETDISGLSPHSENISVFPSVDQIAVLQKSDVFITHCGMNSASESLYFGVPMLLFPQTKEQSGVAKRIEQVGAGLLLTEKMDILQGVRHILRDGRYKENAIKISESFKRCGGAAEAATVIENVAAG